MRCLVTGAGGFIGGHLVKRLLADGHSVKATDIKDEGEWWQQSEAYELPLVDLSCPDECAIVVNGVDWVFHLAADMGGMGFIESHKADCMLNVLADTNMLVAATAADVERFYYSSTACVYPQRLQNFEGHGVISLAESMAYPADPEDGYGWEKLFIERMCRHFTEDYGLEVRIGRHHTTYGEHGSWNDGREKVPAALCRKVAEVKHGLADYVEVWGDGKQVRSFLHVDDAVDGILRVMESDIREPVNIGSEDAVTVEGLLGAVQIAAGVDVLEKRYVDGPQGVRARCSDSTLLKSLGWTPNVSLQDGVQRTYDWVEERVRASA